MTYRIAVCLLGFFVLTASSVIAEEPAAAQADAELTAVVRASYEACRKGKWDTYAKLMDPRDLAEFKQKLRPVLQAAPVNPAVPGN